MGHRFLVVAALAALALSPTLTARPAPAGPDPDLAASLDHARLAGLSMGEETIVRGFELEAGLRVDLDLRRFDILAPDARVVVGGPAGDRDLPRPDLVLLRGGVAGEPGSRAMIGVSPYGTNGFVERAGSLHYISTGPAAMAGARPLRVTNAAALPIAGGAPFCQVDAGEEWYPLGRPEPGPAAAGPLGPPCRVARVAIETDWEFTGNLFGGNTNASTDYALSLLAAVSEIYQTDLNVRLQVSFVRVWSANDDPYNAGSASDALNQFRDYWAANEGDVDREVAHYLSGRSLGGGVAWLGVLCSTSFGYGVSGNLNGFFPYPLQDHNGANWDVIVSAHEIGHNFGTGHTHEYNPPIDGCGNGDCANASDGTIMSYCHLCSGGIANINLTFHPIVRTQILGYLDGACDIESAGVAAVDDDVDNIQGEPLMVDVLVNDAAVSCDTPQIGVFDSVGTRGATISLVPAGGGFEYDRLLYTPLPETVGAEYFSYTVVGGNSALVRVITSSLRAADITGPTLPGAEVAYYALSSPQVLPDFDELMPYADDVVASIDFSSTGGNFVTSGLSDEVGAVFQGYVTVPENGTYDFFTESDDGSALYVGNELVVINDGLHAMQERSGSIGLQAGPHAVRVEFFENGGGAGLIVRWQGPSFGKQTIPGSAWSYATPCGLDLDGNGEVGFSDVLGIIGSWGPCGPSCPFDANGDGEVGFADILAVIGAWGPC